MVILTLLWADLEVGRIPEIELPLRQEEGRHLPGWGAQPEQSSAMGLFRGGRCSPPGRELHSHWVMVWKAIW